MDEENKVPRKYVPGTTLRDYEFIKYNYANIPYVLKTESFEFVATESEDARFHPQVKNRCQRIVRIVTAGSS
jgi:hypothetical protein